MSNQMIALAPLAIDLSTDSATTTELILSLLVLSVIAVLLLVGKWREQYSGLPEDQKRHAKALIGQLENQSPTTLSWRPSELQDEDETPLIREALVSTPGTDVQPDRATLSQAAKEVSAAWTSAIQSVTTQLPTLAVRLLSLAGGIAIFGPIAVYALEKWRNAVHTDDGLSVDVAIDALAGITNTFTDTSAELILSFPYFGDLWALAFSFAILGWELIYNHPLIVAALLATTGVLVVFLDRRLIRDDEYRTDRVQTVTVPRVLFTVFGLWAIGVSPTALFGLFGAAELGAAVGFGLAAVSAIGMLYWAGSEFVTSLRTEARVRWPDDPNQRVAAWIVAKRIGHALVPIGAVLIPLYIVDIIVKGRAQTVAGILLEARLGVKILLGAIIFTVIAVSIYRARSALPDLKVALGDLVKDRSVKLLVFGAGMPFFALGAVYLYVHHMTSSVAIALGIALIAGVTVRGVYLLMRAVRYRASLLSSEPTQPFRVVDHCYQLTDADGRTHYLVRTNGTKLAHRDPDVLAEAVADAHEDILDTDVEGIRPSVAKQYAKDLLNLGIVHVDTPDHEETPSTMKRLRSEMRRKTFGGLENANGRMPVDEYREELSDLPEPVVKEELPKYRYHGTREGTVIIDGGWVTLVE